MTLFSQKYHFTQPYTMFSVNPGFYFKDFNLDKTFIVKDH